MTGSPFKDTIIGVALAVVVSLAYAAITGKDDIKQWVWDNATTTVAIGALYLGFSNLRDKENA